MRNYPLFLEEVARVLRPGGVVILIENEIKPITEGKVAIEAGPRGGAPGWHAFWEQYRRCLTGNGIDTTVPTRLPSLLSATGAFDDVVAQEATIPVGFWPKVACRNTANLTRCSHFYFIFQKTYFFPCFLFVCFWHFSSALRNPLFLRSLLWFPSPLDI